MSTPTPLLPDAQRIAEIEGRLESLPYRELRLSPDAHAEVQGLDTDPCDGEQRWVHAASFSGGCTEWLANSALFAHAPEDLRYLLTQLAAVSAERDEARKAAFAAGITAAVNYLHWSRAGETYVGKRKLDAAIRGVSALIPAKAEKGTE